MNCESNQRNVSSKYAKLRNRAVSGSYSSRFCALKAENAYRLVIYTDASFAGLPDTVSSAARFIIFLSDGEKAVVLASRSFNIKRVCRSTLAAETMAALEGVEEGIFIRKLFFATIWPQCDEKPEIRLPIQVLTDSKSLIDSITSLKLVADKRLRVDMANITNTRHWCYPLNSMSVKWVSISLLSN